MTDNVDEYLAHFGVKGMRWGKRKPESQDRINDGNHTSPKNPKNVAKADKKAAKASSKPNKGENSYRQLVKRSTISKLENKNALNERLVAGKGSGLDVLKAVGRTSILELAVNGGSLKKAAANRLADGKATVERIKSGNATKADKALAVQNTTLLDLLAARK